MNANGTPHRSDGWPDDANRPVFAEPLRTRAKEQWWAQLGLTSVRAARASRSERAAERAREHVLASVRPVGFVRETDGATLTLDDIRAEFDRIEDEAAERSRDDAHQRREHGWRMVRDALNAPDAGEPIKHGPWAVFTRGKARAWCWNLFQYEPHGFVHPGSPVRAEALELLERDGLPKVFGYPERAAALEAQGLTPEGYRTAQEALGRPTYSPEDVSFSA